MISNTEYQAVLNQVYQGTVTPKEKYISPHATILHYCSECGVLFYARPLWLVYTSNGKHECNRYANKHLTESDIDKFITHFRNGKSVESIARLYKVRRKTIRYHLKKEGLY